MARLLIPLLFALMCIHCVAAYSAPPPAPRRSVSELDHMIRQCFQTQCKEWMTECHWFCDSIKGQSFYRRCMDCLGWRGQNCMECFDL